MNKLTEKLSQKEKEAIKLYQEVASKIIVPNKQEQMSPLKIAMIWDELRKPFENVFFNTTSSRILDEIQDLQNIFYEVDSKERYHALEMLKHRLLSKNIEFSKD